MSDDSQDVAQQSQSSNNRKRDRVIDSDSEDQDVQQHVQVVTPKRKGRPKKCTSSNGPTITTKKKRVSVVKMKVAKKRVLIIAHIH